MEYAVEYRSGWSEKDQKHTVEIRTNHGTWLVDSLASSHHEAIQKGKALVLRKAPYGPGRDR